MNPQVFLSWSTGIVAALLVILNVLHLVVGLPRVFKVVASGELPARFADPMVVAWVYIGVLNVAIGIVLFAVLRDLAAGSAVAAKVVGGLGGALIAVGIGAYAVTGRHPGLLGFSVMGAILLAPIVMFRSHFGS